MLNVSNPLVGLWYVISHIPDCMLVAPDRFIRVNLMLTRLFVSRFVSFLFQFVYKFLIDGYGTVVPQLGSFVSQLFVSVRMIEEAQGLYQRNMVFVSIDLRYAANLAGQ